MTTKTKMRSARVTMLLVCLSALAPPAFLLADDVATPSKSAASMSAAQLTDVQLAKSGILVGYVLDGQGHPVKNEQVRIFHHDRRIASAVTNKQGAYLVKGLRGGVHVVHAKNSRGSFRFWTNKSAPPSAKSVALNVVDAKTIRGQMGSLYGGNPNTALIGAIGLAGLVVAIDKQESINDLKTAVTQLEAENDQDGSVSLVTGDSVIGTLSDPLPVSP